MLDLETITTIQSRILALRTRFIWKGTWPITTMQKVRFSFPFEKELDLVWEMRAGCRMPPLPTPFSIDQASDNDGSTGVEARKFLPSIVGCSGEIDFLIFLSLDSSIVFAHCGSFYPSMGREMHV